FLAKAPELIAVPEEGEEPIADQVHGGLMPGDVEQDAGGEQLALAQLVALLLRGDEQAQKVIAGMPAPLGQELAEVVADGPPRHPAPLDDIGIHLKADGVEAARDVCGPSPDRLLVARRDAE